MDIVSTQTSAREYLSPSAKVLEESLLEEFNVLPTNEDPNYRYLNVIFNGTAIGGMSIQDLIRNAARNNEKAPDGAAMASAKAVIAALNSIAVGAFKRTPTVAGFALEFRCAPRKGSAAAAETNQVTMKDLLASLLG